ncbi:MAG: excisionase [Lachnospiraceae bacterium]|nr:excisionase [Lachnospiraceae bacterium]
MDKELLVYKRKLEERLSDKPLWEKECLTVDEAAEYSGIGRTKIRQLIRKKKCPFITQMGTQYFIIRKKFDSYIEKQISI